MKKNAMAMIIVLIIPSIVLIFPKIVQIIPDIIRTEEEHIRNLIKKLQTDMETKKDFRKLLIWNLLTSMIKAMLDPLLSNK